MRALIVSMLLGLAVPGWAEEPVEKLGAFIVCEDCTSDQDYKIAVRDHALPGNPQLSPNDYASFDAYLNPKDFSGTPFDNSNSTSLTAKATYFVISTVSEPLEIRSYKIQCGTLDPQMSVYYNCLIEERPAYENQDIINIKKFLEGAVSDGFELKMLTEEELRKYGQKESEISGRADLPAADKPLKRARRSIESSSSEGERKHLFIVGETKVPRAVAESAWDMPANPQKIKKFADYYNKNFPTSFNDLLAHSLLLTNVLALIDTDIVTVAKFPDGTSYNFLLKGYPIDRLTIGPMEGNDWDGNIVALPSSENGPYVFRKGGRITFEKFIGALERKGYEVDASSITDNDLKNGLQIQVYKKGDKVTIRKIRESGSEEKEGSSEEETPQTPTQPAPLPPTAPGDRDVIGGGPFPTDIPVEPSGPPTGDVDVGWPQIEGDGEWERPFHVGPDCLPTQRQPVCN